MSKCEYKIIRTEDELKELVDNLLRRNRFVFDLETSSLETHSEDIKIVGIGFCFKRAEAYYIPFNYALSPKIILDYLLPVFTDSTIGKIGHNIKYDCRCLDRFGIRVNNIVFDTMVASYCLYGDRTTHNLDDLSLHHLNHVKIRTKSVIPRKTKENPNPSMLDMEVEKVALYNCEDVDFTYRLYELFNQLLNHPGNEHCKKIFYEIDLPLVTTLISMECSGVKISESLLDELKVEVSNKLVTLQTNINQAAGREIALTKPLDVCKLLYEDLKLDQTPGLKIEKTPGGQLSTAAKQIEKLEGLHPVVDHILEYKLLTKIMSTYITSIPEYISKHTGLLHPFFGQTMTSTARLNSSDPNCQNIPAKNPIGKRIREAFISRFPGGKILAADFSQAELRILAHMGQEKVFLKAFNEDVDVHLAVAADVIYEIAKELVTKEQRTKVKVLNFGLLYGMRAKKLALGLGIDILEATDIMVKYMAKMSGLKKFLDDARLNLKERGYTENYFGRRRYIPNIYSFNQMEVWSAEREGANNIIQSTNADIIRIAMNRIHNMLDSESRKSKMILQVHDELVFDLHPEEVEILPPKIRDIMESVVKFDVLMKVDAKIGDSWSSAH